MTLPCWRDERHGERDFFQSFDGKHPLRVQGVLSTSVPLGKSMGVRCAVCRRLCAVSWRKRAEIVAKFGAPTVTTTSDTTPGEPNNEPSSEPNDESAVPTFKVAYGLIATEPDEAWSDDSIACVNRVRESIAKDGENAATGAPVVVQSGGDDARPKHKKRKRASANVVSLGKWLERIGLASLAVNFEEAGFECARQIEPDVLGTITEAEFRDMGIARLGHLRRLLVNIDMIQDIDLKAI